ncbi:MAG: tetratricopeptide repeat protein, partial [Rhodospirillaceae bacterium]|nr:tetratricopeptide repeat protein [Rhodospirillaceae bacterium]
QKKLPEAVKAYEAALARQPAYPEALSNLGIVYRDLEDVNTALQCFHRAVQQRPTYAEARYNLANAYRDQTRLSEAEAEIRKVIELNPAHTKAYNTLGNILSESARSEEALAAFETAAKLDPTSLATASNILSCLQYVPGVDDQTLAAAHTHWVGTHNNIFTAPVHQISDKTPDRPLRVGFVSADLGHHPCGFLSVGLFENLDRAQVSATVFSSRRAVREDHLSQRIAAVTDWRRVEALSDAELAADIASANIDILIDMSGHTSGHRLAAFARKPAPVQMTWLGYVGSTGLPTMDYIIADRWHAPEGVSITGPEKILRLADGYTCYEPPAGVGDVAPLPALHNGYVTFGCLNNATKLNSTLVRSYAEIMALVPRSRIVLAFRGLDDSGVKKRLLDWFLGAGIETARVDIRGYAKHHAFLAHYNDIDIALDTFPYSGGLTTCEALWMGVPVVTFPGRTFAGRHSVSYMSNAGLSDFVALGRTDFQNLAAAKAQNIPALADLRKTLREKLKASPVCDAKRFAGSFTAGLREAWRAYCAG